MKLGQFAILAACVTAIVISAEEIAFAYFPDHIGEVRDSGLASSSGVLPAATCISWLGREVVCSPANEQIVFKDTAGTSGVCLDTTTDGTWTLKNRDCSAAAPVVASSGTLAAAGTLAYTGREILSSPADDQFQLTDTAATSGVCLSTATDGTWTFMNRGCAANGTLMSGSSTVDAVGYYAWLGRSALYSSADARANFQNAAGTSKLQLMFDASLGMAIYGLNRTDDANGLPMAIKPESVSPFAAAAKTAPDLLLGGGSDSKTVVFTPAGANPDTGGLCTAADTVTVTANGTAVGTCTYTTYCAAGCATRNAAAVALAACIDGFAGVGASVGTQAGGVADTVGVVGDAPTTSIVLSQNDATCSAISNGTDGYTVLRTGGGSTVDAIKIASIAGAKYIGSYLASVGGSANYFVFSATGDGVANGDLWGRYFVASSGVRTGTYDTSGAFGVQISTLKGAIDLRTPKSATITFAGGGGAASMTSAAAIPLGATALKISCRNIVAGSTCTSYDVGSFVGDNSYGSLISPALSTTFVSPISYGNYLTVGDIVITANGGNCVSLSVRCTFSYFIDTADTAN